MLSYLDVNFWANAWQTEGVKLGFNDPDDNGQLLGRWDRKAKDYDQKPPGSSPGKKFSDTWCFLEKAGVFHDTLTVLDIGCGPGSFAIPFAKKGLVVTALDPVEKMLSRLTTAVESENLTGITPILGLWEKADIKENNWSKKFGLVFASLCPGINNLAAIQKMNACSQKYCFLSTFDGRRQVSTYNDFWLAMFNAPLPAGGPNIIYPFNIIYSLGFRPFLEFFDISYQRTIGTEELEAELKYICQRENVLDKISQARLEDYVTSVAAHGEIIEQVTSTVGMMVWRTDILIQ